MLNKIIFFLLTLATAVTYSQTVGPQNQPQDQKTVGKAYLSGQIVGAENQQIGFGNQNVGGIRSPLYTTTADAEGKFSFTYELPFADYYFLKFHNNQMLNLILYGNDTIKIYGDLRNIMEISNFVGSEESEAMNQFLIAHADFKHIEDSLTMVVRTNPSKQTEVNDYFKPFAEDFYAKRNKFINIYSGSPAIVVCLNAMNQETEWELYKSVVNLLQQSYGQSPTVNNIAQYVANKTQEMEAIKFLNPGNPARDIALPSPKGDTLRLSDLKGKVVLIEFCASWCRPCRMENPNVVNLYKMYKDEGFTVYSVSLDSNLDSWIAAIEQDGLIWPYHVSDLKKWQSVAASQYLVKSIPFTVLIGKDGNIIGSNIRGVDLQNQLKAIFGH